MALPTIPVFSGNDMAKDRQAHGTGGRLWSMATSLVLLWHVSARLGW